MNRRSRRERGIALLIALLVLTILIILVGQMVLSTSHSRSVADNAMADLQNSYGAKAGYAVAVEFLKADGEKEPAVDTINEKWASGVTVPPMKAGTVTVKIEDCERKINLCMMVDEQGVEQVKVSAMLKRLLQRFGHDATVAERILDYQDKDVKGNFEAGARNERLFNLDELLRIEGMPPEALFGDDLKKGILPFVTVWPRTQGPPQQGQVPVTGKINVNTAPVEVLESLADDMTPQIAQAIVDKRTGQTPEGGYEHFTKPQDLLQVSGMTQPLYQLIAPQVSVKAGAFEIHVKSESNGVSKKWIYVVARSSGGPSPSPSPSGSPSPSPSPSPGGQPAAATLTLIAAMPENDFLTVKPPPKEED